MCLTLLIGSENILFQSQETLGMSFRLCQIVGVVSKLKANLKFGPKSKK